MRIQAGEEYVRFIEDFLNQKQFVKPKLKDYEFQVFDDVAKMHRAIIDKDRDYGLSRLVAGFAWPWITNPANGTPKQDFDIEIDNYKIRWNSRTKDWVNSPGAVNEVGCIHTVQGYGMNYVGVIVGPELYYDETMRKITVDRSKYCDRNGHAGITDPKELERYIKNIYRTLLTRGIKGTYVYIVDKNLRNYFKKQFGQEIIGIDLKEIYNDNKIISPYIRKIVRIPLVGSAPCGNPLLSEENIEEYIEVGKK